MEGKNSFDAQSVKCGSNGLAGEKANAENTELLMVWHTESLLSIYGRLNRPRRDYNLRSPPDIGLLKRDAIAILSGLLAQTLIYEYRKFTTDERSPFHVFAEPDIRRLTVKCLRTYVGCRACATL